MLRAFDCEKAAAAKSELPSTSFPVRKFGKLKCQNVGFYELNLLSLGRNVNHIEDIISTYHSVP